MINKERLNNYANEIWKSAESLRGKFKPYEYQNVVLPMIVIRRIECVLEKEREILKASALKSKPKASEKEIKKFTKDLELQMLNISFFNKTDWTLKKIFEDDQTKLEDHFRDYIKGFSDNIQEIVDKFNFRETIKLMANRGGLAPIIKQYSEEKLGPETISNLEMGYIYEELLRKFSEQSGEEAGEHFTPREVIRLMVEILDIKVGNKRISIYDPACGTGGMLSVAKEHLLEKAKDDKEKNKIDDLVTIYGQELSDTNYAVCKADMLIKGDKNSKITCGNSLIPDVKTDKERGDQHADDKFDYMLSNPPFGVSWTDYQKKAEKLKATRYKAGMPQSSDGAFLFLQTMIEKMKTPKEGGSRIAIVFNGSPSFSGGAGSGPSNIRRWIIEETDLLEAIIGLPDQMFYNTGILTYIWVLSNTKKGTKREEKVQLINTNSHEFFKKAKKSLGNKRNEIDLDGVLKIAEVYRNFEESEHSKIFDLKDFGYTSVTVERPLKLNFQVSDERLEKLKVEKSFIKLSDTPEGVKSQKEIIKVLKKIDSSKVFKNRDDFINELEKLNLDVNASLKKGIMNALSERDDEAIPCMTKGKVEADSELRDSENIPLWQSIDEYFKTEVTPHVPDAWMDRDKDQIGYEISFSKYFYKYQPLRKLEDICKDILDLEKATEGMIKEVLND